MTRPRRLLFPRLACLALLLGVVLTAGAAHAADGDAGAPDAGVVAPADDGGSGPADGAVSVDGGADAAAAPLPPPPPPVAPVPAAVPVPPRLEVLTVVGTREAQTAGSAHILRPRDLQRMDYDNPEKVVKQVPGVYIRGEDGFGLRPNIGIRGTSPDRSKKITLMEDGILFAPAPYAAPAAYFFPLMTRFELVRVIKGPGAVSFGPNTVGGAIDLVTRGIPSVETAAIDLATGSYGYGKLHGYFGASTARSGFVLEGIRLQASGFKELDGGGNTGFEKNEWMWKGHYLLSNDPNAFQSVGLKLGYSDEDSRESYLGLTDADLRANPNRRYRASRLDRMQWHRTQIAATYHARFAQAFTIDAVVYRNDFSRTWRRLKRMGTSTPLASILANPDTAANAVSYSVLTGAENWSGDGDTIYIGPNQRQFVSQGVQVVGGWAGTTGPVAHRVEAGVRFHYDRVDLLQSEDGYKMIDGNLIHDGKPTIVTHFKRTWAQALALHLISASTWGPVTFTPGLRVELIDSWERDRLTHTEIQSSPQRVVIPGIGIYGALTKSLGLLAGVYRGFSPAAPSLPGTVKPETSVNYEAGIRYAPARLRLEAIGFYNDYQNLTSVCAESGSCPEILVGQQSDAGHARIYGAELFARADVIVRPGYTIPLLASYTYTQAEFLRKFNSFDPSWGMVEAGDELPYVPRNQGSVTAAVETPRGSLAISGSYVSAMRERAGPAGQPASPNEPMTDPSFILDATARVYVAAAGNVYLSVRNMLGAEDIAARVPFGARPVAPRWIQIGTKWSF